VQSIGKNCSKVNLIKLSGKLCNCLSALSVSQCSPFTSQLEVPSTLYFCVADPYSNNIYMVKKV